MMAFVAILLCMGINKRPRYSMHWSMSEVLRSPLYSSTMASNRFTAILRFLHLANNQAEVDQSPIQTFQSSPSNLIKRDTDPQFYQRAGQLCVVWQDTKRVTLLTNYGNCSVTTKQIRSKKSSTGYREIPKPSIVNDYNKYMGGCDLAGQLCKYYTHNHRTLKWWKRLFVTILDICLLNATIVYKRGGGGEEFPFHF